MNESTPSPRDVAVGTLISDATTGYRIREWLDGSKAKGNRPSLAELRHHGYEVCDRQVLATAWALLDAWTGYVGDEDTNGTDDMTEVSDVIGRLRDQLREHGAMLPVFDGGGSDGRP